MPAMAGVERREEEEEEEEEVGMVVGGRVGEGVEVRRAEGSVVGVAMEGVEDCVGVTVWGC
jgi:hypothetical protein